jgi:valyl-tRNA synthetase
LEGIIDIGKEKAKLESKLTKIESDVKAKEKTLGNKEFIRKAPPEIVEAEKTKLAQLKETFKRIKAVRDELK